MSLLSRIYEEESLGSKEDQIKELRLVNSGRGLYRKKSDVNSVGIAYRWNGKKFVSQGDR